MITNRMNFTGRVFAVPPSRVGNERRPDECWEPDDLRRSAGGLLWVHQSWKEVGYLLLSEGKIHLRAPLS